MRRFEDAWVDRWLVGQDEKTGEYGVVAVKAKRLPERGVWMCDLRDGCRHKHLAEVPDGKVYETEAIALARVRELQQDSS